MTLSAAVSGNEPTDGARPIRDPSFDVESLDFGAVYQGQLDLVVRTLRRYGVPEASLDDAVQDAFLVIYTRLASFEGRSSLRTWVFGIARRVARDHRPSARTHAETVDDDTLEALPDVDSKSPLATLEAIEGARLLESLLAGLAPDKREAFILVELEQMTVLEAGEALGVNANTMSSRVRAARREFEQALARIAVGLGAAAAFTSARDAAAAIPGGGPGSTNPHPPASYPGAGAGGSATLAGGFAKWAVVSLLIAAGGGVGLGLYITRGRTPAMPALMTPPPTAPPPTQALAPLPVTEQPVAPDREGATAHTPGPAGELRAHREPSASPGGSAQAARAFERELQLLRSARRALDAGSPAQSLALLDRYAAEFPRGALKSECQATRILALCAAGRVASAQQARDQFLEQQPRSPLAERVRTMCGSGR